MAGKGGDQVSDAPRQQALRSIAEDKSAYQWHTAIANTLTTLIDAKADHP